MRKTFVLLAVVYCSVVGDSVADSADSALRSAIADSLVAAVDADHYRIGNLLLSKSTREISIPGHVNMHDGLVEYLAVTPTGKTHEAVLVLDVQPLHLQTALLLLGCDYGRNLAYQGDTTMPIGDTLELALSWKEETGEIYTIAADQAVCTYPDSAHIAIPWVFTGSLIWPDGLRADDEGSIIATYADPVAIINNGGYGRGDDTVLGANPRVLPPKGTTVSLIIRPKR